MSNDNGVQTKILTWSLLGGVLGAVIGIINKHGVAIPGMPFNNSGAAVVTLAQTLLGILIGGILGIISLRFSKYQVKPRKPLQEQQLNNKLQLKEERLDISKKLIQTGQVEIHKEVFEEQKTITVPIAREELVIKRTDLESQEDDTLRIPLSEEDIEVMKHPKVINDVSIYKKKFTKNKQVKETLKKEKLHMETTGDPKIKKV